MPVDMECACRQPRQPSHGPALRCIQSRQSHGRANGLRRMESCSCGCPSSSSYPSICALWIAPWPMSHPALGECFIDPLWAAHLPTLLQALQDYLWYRILCNLLRPSWSELLPMNLNSECERLSWLSARHGRPWLLLRVPCSTCLQGDEPLNDANLSRHVEQAYIRAGGIAGPGCTCTAFSTCLGCSAEALTHASLCLQPAGFDNLLACSRHRSAALPGRTGLPRTQV